MAACTQGSGYTPIAMTPTMQTVMAATSTPGTGSGSRRVGASMLIRARHDEVVVERHDGQDRAEERQPVEPAVHDGPEESVELGPETRHERDTSERQQKHQHRQRQYQGER